MPSGPEKLRQVRLKSESAVRTWNLMEVWFGSEADQLMVRKYAGPPTNFWGERNSPERACALGSHIQVSW